MLSGIELFSNWSEVTHPDHRVYLIGWLGWLLFGYGVVMAGWLIVESHRKLPAAAPT